MSGDQDKANLEHDRAGELPSAASRSPARFVLVCVMLPACWLGMMAVHEAGHVLGAWATGGTVARVVLHPLSISRTDVEPNPVPLVVAWAGPAIGILLPIILWAVLSKLEVRVAFLARFFAGFCSAANGLYLGIGSFDRVGDAGDLLRSGASLWHLWLFEGLAVVAGLFMWNGQGRSFGFGPHASAVSWREVSLVAVLLAVLVAAGLALN